MDSKPFAPTCCPRVGSAIGEARAHSCGSVSPRRRAFGHYACVRASGIVGLVALVGLIASCGGSSAKASDTSANAPVSTTTSAALRVGGTARNPVMESVLMYADNVLGTTATELPSNRAIAEVRACATPKLNGTALVQASDFEMTLNNGQTQAGSSDANVTSPLRPSTLAGSDCTTGNVAWHLPDGQHARTITDTKRRATWTVSCPSTAGACVLPARPGVVPPPATMPTAP